MLKFTKTNIHYTRVFLLCLYFITIFFGDFKYPILHNTLIILVCIITLIETYKFKRKKFIPLLISLLVILAIVLILYSLQVNQAI